MAYRKQQERVISGSLNLVPPTDKVPAGDSIRLQNWREDQAGQLMSRRGLLADSADLGAEIHSLFRFTDDRYGGVGGSLLYGGTLGSTVQTGFDGEPLGFAPYLNFIWVMNRAKQGKVQNNVWYEWLPDAPTSAPNAEAGEDGSLSGDFLFYVTFDTPYGHETNPSPASVEVTLDNQQVIITGIPTSSDSQVTKRHIYGIGGDLDVALRFVTIHNNTQTSITFNIDLDEVTRQNIEMPTDADPPPPAEGLLGPYFGKLIAWSSIAHPARMWWTPTGQPWKWPGSDDEVEGNWFDVGDEGERIMYVTHHPRMLVIYKERSIWRLLRDPDDNDPEQSSAVLGAISKRGVTPAGAVDYFVGPEGLYRFNGDWADPASVKVQTIFKHDYLPYYPPIHPNHRDKCVLRYRNERLYFSYPDADSETNNYGLVHDIGTGRWIRYYSTLGGFTAMFDEGEQGAFLGAIDGVLYQVGVDWKHVDGADTAIPLVWQSAFLDQGLPDNPKWYADVVIKYRTGAGDEAASSLTLKAVFDDGVDATNDYETLGTLSSMQIVTERFPIGTDDKGRKAKNISILVEGDATSTVWIFDVYIHYYVEERYAKTFDSGVIPLADGKVGKIEQLELDVTAPGNLALTISTDLPGETITSRKTVSWGGASGRRTLMYQFDGSTTAKTAPEGRRGRFQLTSAADYQLHRFRYRVLPIGVYIDGAAGEKWIPQPF